MSSTVPPLPESFPDDLQIDIRFAGKGLVDLLAAFRGTSYEKEITDSIEWAWREHCIRKEREREYALAHVGQLSLGQLIAAFEKVLTEDTAGFPVYFRYPSSTEDVPYILVPFSGGCCSYRGYYDHLTLEPSKGPPVGLADCIEILKENVGATYGGWKGGEYTMYGDTPTWVSPHGVSEDYYPVGVVVRRDDEDVVVEIRKVGVNCHGK